MPRLLPLTLVLLAGCASDPSAPSLARRPAEALDLSEPVRTVEAAAPADSALAASIKTLTDQAEAGHKAFLSILPRARAAASGAGTEGSERWIAAQQLLSAAEDARAPTTRALGELDSLVSSRLTGGKEEGLVELQAAEAAVSTLADGQQAELDRLRDMLNR